MMSSEEGQALAGVIAGLKNEITALESKLASCENALRGSHDEIADLRRRMLEDEKRCAERHSDTTILSATEAEVRELQSRLQEALERDTKGDQIIVDLTLRLDRAVRALEAIRDGIPGPALLAIDTLNGLKRMESDTMRADYERAVENQRRECPDCGADEHDGACEVPVFE